MTRFSVFFWPHTVDKDVASFRIRCKKIVKALTVHDQDNSYSYSINCPSRADLIILSKRYDKKSVDQALLLKEKFKTKVYLDLCDNHFLNDPMIGSKYNRALQLIDTIKRIDGVFASSFYLKKIIQDNCGNEFPIIVIGDIVECPSLNDTLSFSNFIPDFKYYRFSKKINNIMPQHARRLVWFGNHQGNFSESGMSDLNLVKEKIEEINAQKPISLTIISNSEKKFNSIFKNWKTKCLYFEWNKKNFSKVLCLHSVSIIPASKNDFTYSKTDNRVTTSLIHGLQVIADPIPSYLEHIERIFINNWADSLSKLINHEINLDSDFNPHDHNSVIINNWHSIIKKIIINE